MDKSIFESIPDSPVWTWGHDVESVESWEDPSNPELIWVRNPHNPHETRSINPKELGRAWKKRRITPDTLAREVGIERQHVLAFYKNQKISPLSLLRIADGLLNRNLRETKKSESLPYSHPKPFIEDTAAGAIVWDR